MCITEAVCERGHAQMRVECELSADRSLQVLLLLLLLMAYAPPSILLKQGLSPLLEDEYERANHAWSLVTARLANMKKEAGQLESPQLTQEEIETYIADLHGVLRTGTTTDRQELLRRFIRTIVLYPSHVEIGYNFGPTTLAPLGNFGVSRSPIEGAPRGRRHEDPHSTI